MKKRQTTEEYTDELNNVSPEYHRHSKRVLTMAQVQEKEREASGWVTVVRNGARYLISPKQAKKLGLA